MSVVGRHDPKAERYAVPSPALADWLVDSQVEHIMRIDKPSVPDIPDDVGLGAIILVQTHNRAEGERIVEMMRWRHEQRLTHETTPIYDALSLALDE
jgi:hypothetical protein